MPKRSNSGSQQSGNKMASVPSPKPTDTDPSAPTSYAAVAHQPPPGDIPSPPHSTIDDDKERLQQQGYELVGRAIEAYPPGKPYSTGIDEAPLTLERTPFIPAAEGEPLLDAGTARATMAASSQAPNGTVDGAWARRHQDQTVLQQHVAYFDADGDGVIWPYDTYVGCRRWGWLPPLALLVAAIIHGALAYPTLPKGRLLPDPFCRIYLAGIHRAKHGSDSGTYDNEGRFRPQQFEDVFAKYDDGDKGGLDVYDLLRMWRGLWVVMDLFGATAAALEWFATYLLLWPDDGLLRKDDVRRVYDGSIFQHKADEYAALQRRRQHGRVQAGSAAGLKKRAGAWWSHAAAKIA